MPKPTTLNVMERDIFNGLKAELARAFAAPDSAYRPLDADTVIRRGQRRSDG